MLDCTDGRAWACSGRKMGALTTTLRRVKVEIKAMIKHSPGAVEDDEYQRSQAR